MKSIVSAALIGAAQAYYGAKLSSLRKMHEEMAAVKTLEPVVAAAAVEEMEDDAQQQQVLDIDSE